MLDKRDSEKILRYFCFFFSMETCCDSANGRLQGTILLRNMEDDPQIFVVTPRNLEN